MSPAEIIAEMRRQAALRNATWPGILLVDLMPLCDEFERIEREIENLRSWLDEKEHLIRALQASDASARECLKMANDELSLISESESEYEDLRKDALRYRWLRDVAYHAPAGPNGKMVWCVIGEGCGKVEPIRDQDLDDAIDAYLPWRKVG